MGTVRLSEIFAVAEQAKQTIASSAAAPPVSTPASQLPTERMRKTPPAAVGAPASRISAETLSNTVTPQPVVSDLGAAARGRAMVAPTRAGHGLRGVLVAALVASVVGSLAVVWLMRRPVLAAAPEPATTTAASEPLPTAAPPPDSAEPVPAHDVPLPPPAAPVSEPSAPPLSVAAPRRVKPLPTARVLAHPAPAPVAPPRPSVVAPAPPQPVEEKRAPHRTFGVEN